MPDDALTRGLRHTTRSSLEEHSCPRSWSSTRTLVALDVKKGDEIIFSKYGGTEIKLSGDEYLILRESDILAKVVSSKVAAKA